MWMHRCNYFWVVWIEDGQKYMSLEVFQYELYSRTFMVAAHPNFLNGIFFGWKSETLKNLLPPIYSQ
jgi:hypothetical protein